jgi:hypothetical protein
VAEAVEENADGGNTPVELTGEELFAFIRKVAEHQVNEVLSEINQRLSDLEMVAGILNPGSQAATEERLDGGVPWYTG